MQETIQINFSKVWRKSRQVPLPKPPRMHPAEGPCQAKSGRPLHVHLGVSKKNSSSKITIHRLKLNMLNCGTLNQINLEGWITRAEPDIAAAGARCGCGFVDFPTIAFADFPTTLFHVFSTSSSDFNRSRCQCGQLFSFVSIFSYISMLFPYIFPPKAWVDLYICQRCAASSGRPSPARFLWHPPVVRCFQLQPLEKIGKLLEESWTVRIAVYTVHIYIWTDIYCIYLKNYCIHAFDYFKGVRLVMNVLHMYLMYTADMPQFETRHVWSAPFFHRFLATMVQQNWSVKGLALGFLATCCLALWRSHDRLGDTSGCSCWKATLWFWMILKYFEIWDS